MSSKKKITKSKISRADQLSLEQRRNAINAKEEKETKKEKTKKTKEEKEEKRKRKEEKKARRKNSEESGGAISPALINKPETCRLSPSSSSSDLREPPSASTPAPASASASASARPGEQKSSLVPPTSSPSASNSSPASILKEERALERRKSLKRVSFEEQPDIIDDRESTVEVEVRTASVGEEEEDIPALEQVDQKVDKKVGKKVDYLDQPQRPQTPPGDR